MTPDYLLHLDFQSIRLFHREESGIWRLVGRAAPDDHALDEAMKALVGRARARSDAPMHAVISLPHDLIFVTKVKTDPEQGWVRRKVDIRTALDLTLSDPIEEVAFDTETEGAETTAVVVHRDTIAEADGFAKAHGIEPLAFISMPRDGDGFHRPAIFMQTPLGDERAGEAGSLIIDVPGTAALRGNVSSQPMHRPVQIPQTESKMSEAEASLAPTTAPIKEKSESVETDDLAENTDSRASTTSKEDTVSEASTTSEENTASEADGSVFEAAIRNSSHGSNVERITPKPEPVLSEQPAPTPGRSPAKKVVVDPFDKIAHPFVERPQDDWWGLASRLLAPLAAVLAVGAVIAVIAIYVLPPNEEEPELARASEEIAEPTGPAGETAQPDQIEPAAEEPRDPLTAPEAEDAPETPVQEPSVTPEDSPAPAIEQPEAVAGLSVPEDPTEPVALSPLPSALVDESEQPAPLTGELTGPAHGALASPDSAEPEATEAALAAALSRRIGAAQGSAPVPLYDLLEPNLAEEELAEVAARRPEGRPEDLYPVASDGTVLPPEFEGIEERRPEARPADLTPTNAGSTQAEPETEAETELEATTQTEAPAEAPEQNEDEADSQGFVAPESLPEEIQPAQDIRPVARDADASAATDTIAPQTTVPAEFAALVEARPVARARTENQENQAEQTVSEASLADDLVVPNDPVILALIEARPNARSPDLTAPATPEEPATEAEPATEEEAQNIEVAFTALRPEVRPRDLRRTVTNSVSRGTTVPQPSAPEADPQPAAAQTAPSLGRSRLTLVGTAGTATARRALVQMPGGRITSVTVGDRLDGGRVAAIDMTTLVYTRNGRTIRLEMPE